MIPQLIARCAAIEIPSTTQYRQYVPGATTYEVDGVDVEPFAFATTAIRVAGELTAALHDLVVATGRLTAGDGSSDALFGVLDKRTRACELLGLEAS